MRMTNSVDIVQAAENGKQCKCRSDFWEWHSVDPDQTVSENDSVDLDLDQTAENVK